MSVTDIKAAKKWRAIPKETQRMLLDNVFCRECFTTTIVDYSIHDNEHGIVLKGKCKQCGNNVARLLEDE